MAPNTPSRITSSRPTLLKRLHTHSQMSNGDRTSTQPLLPSAQAPYVPSTNVIRRLHCRILSTCAAMSLLCYINHNNIGFAANGMCEDLELTSTHYGLGVLAMYAGLTVIQPFGNELLKMFGGPVWFVIILVAWGGAGIGLGLIQTRIQFYVLMALLGIAQGANFPNCLYYLTLFYPPRMLDASFAGLFAATTFSIPITAVLSWIIVEVSKVVGATPWRLILAGEGMLPIIFAVVVYFTLPASVEKAKFLTSEEKRWLEEETDKKRIAEESMTFKEQVKHVVTNFQVQIAAVSAMCAFGVETVLMFFINLIIRSALNDADENEKETCGTEGGGDRLPIVLTAIPYLLAGIVCLVLSHYAERLKNRKRFAILMSIGSGALLSMWGLLDKIHFAVGYIGLTVAVGTAIAPQVIIFALAAANTTPSARDMSMAYLTTVFTVSGLSFPAIMGVLVDAAGYGPSVALAGCLGIFSGLIVVVVKDPIKKDQSQFGQQPEHERVDNDP